LNPAEKSRTKLYPIKCDLTHEAVKIEVAIAKLSLTGFIAVIKTGMLFVGRRYQCHFELPNSRSPIVVEGQIFKTFDRLSEEKHEVVERLAEVVFHRLTDEFRARIDDFLKISATQK
jgi:hypothetical protein